MLYDPDQARDRGAMSAKGDSQGEKQQSRNAALCTPSSSRLEVRGHRLARRLAGRIRSANGRDFEAHRHRARRAIDAVGCVF